MTTKDKNGKELGIGDEVVMHFTVTAMWPQPDEKDLINIESKHNRFGKIPKDTTDQNFEDVPSIVITSTPAARVILQRKAKPSV